MTVKQTIEELKAKREALALGEITLDKEITYNEALSVKEKIAQADRLIREVLNELST